MHLDEPGEHFRTHIPTKDELADMFSEPAIPIRDPHAALKNMHRMESGLNDVYTSRGERQIPEEPSCTKSGFVRVGTIDESKLQLDMAKAIVGFKEEKAFMKNDAGKNKLSLIDPDFIMLLGDILTFGAKKYTNYAIIPEDLTIGRMSESWKNRAIAEIIYADTAKTQSQCTLRKLWSAETATTEDSSSKIQNTEQDRLSSLQNGKKRIEQELLNTESVEWKILQKEQGIKKLNGTSALATTELLKSTMIIVLQKDAKYVEKSSSSLISTIATSQEDSVEYFVVSATTDSECLETMYLVLEELSLISNPLRKTLLSQGADNWKKCEDTSRYKDAMLRHIYAYLSGEKVDPESGMLHIMHAVCNCMFIVHNEQKQHKDHA